jgi:acyl-CoA thioesterase FadM
VHIPTHICWRIDIDIFGELNNGRTLTLYDLGRLVLGKRTGLMTVVHKNGWGMTMAGSWVRYCRRVKMFQKITMRTNVLGRDDKFMYLNQTMWSKGEATPSIL